MSEEIKPLDLEGMNIYKKLKVDFGSGRTKTIYDEKEAIKEIKQRIQEAVQGLIQEVEAKKTELENKKLKYAKKTNDEGMAIIEVLLSLCDWFKEKIKKYFPDEVKK